MYGLRTLKKKVCQVLTLLLAGGTSNKRHV